MIITLLAFFPFILLIFLLVFQKKSLLFSSFLACFSQLMVSIFFWELVPSVYPVAIVKSFFTAFDVFLIIFGAIFFLNIIRQKRIIEKFVLFLRSLTSDLGLQIILIAFFFENILEGVAGFGTPSVVAAPILIRLGLSPLKAVAISVLGNGLPTIFGAAGTPIRVGFSGLNFGGSLSFYAALINFSGLFIPASMLFIALFDQPNFRRRFLSLLPFSLVSALIFNIYSLLTLTLGQEFPSIVGSLISLITAVIFIRLRLFLPRSVSLPVRSVKPMRIIHIIYPYLFLIFLLVISKIIFGDIHLFFTYLNHPVNLFNPGFSFIAAGLGLSLLWRRKNQIISFSALSFRQSLPPFLVILSMAFIIQLLLASSQNMAGLGSQLQYFFHFFRGLDLVILAPLLGAFGSFITGSATVSNLMFGAALHSSSLISHYDPNLILALQLVGASAGNIIALADILSAETIVGLKNQEKYIIRLTILPCIIYLTLAVLIGLLLK